MVLSSTYAWTTLALERLLFRLAPSLNRLQQCSQIHSGAFLHECVMEQQPDMQKASEVAIQGFAKTVKCIATFEPLIQIKSIAVDTGREFLLTRTEQGQ